MVLKHTTMYVPLLPVTLATVLFAGVNTPVSAQEQGPEGRIRIEVITTENGETKRVTKEFDTGDEGAVQDALREMGVMQHFSFDGEDGELWIDIRDFDGPDAPGRATPPLPPVPPLPPLPPSVGAEPKAWLGVSSTSVSAEGKDTKDGAYVQHVVEGSPAATLGLKEGDVITMVGDVVIKGPGTLVGVVRDHKPGDEVKVAWSRGGKKMNGTVRLAESKESSYRYHFNGPEGRSFDFRGGGEKRAFLGVTPAEEDTKCTVIGTVEEGSAAATMDLRPGDQIRKVNDTEVADFAALSRTIGDMAPGDAVTVTVERDGRTVVLNGTLGERQGWTGQRKFSFEGLSPESEKEIRMELDVLREDLDRMREELHQEGGMSDRIRREMRITIQGRPLAQAEKDLLTKKGVTGLDKELELGDLRCFPNPSNGFFRLQFDVPGRGDLLVTVHDSAGEKVYDERIGGFKGRYERTLDLSDKAAGTYYLVITQGGRTSTQKLIKQ